MSENKIGEFFSGLFGLIIICAFIYGALKWSNTETEFDDVTQVVTITKVTLWGLWEAPIQYKFIDGAWQEKDGKSWKPIKGKHIAVN
jgi:hypothetical protein